MIKAIVLTVLLSSCVVTEVDGESGGLLDIGFWVRCDVTSVVPVDGVDYWYHAGCAAPGVPYARRVSEACDAYVGRPESCATYCEIDYTDLCTIESVPFPAEDWGL